MLESKLDAVPGIGAVRKRRLLLKFGSIQKIAQASLEQLKDEGVPEQVAEILLGTLKEFLK
jgi:excinuclease ABC subunit C